MIVAMTTPRSDEADWERRRRLAAVFGEVLPETTGDDRDAPDGARSTARNDRAPDRAETWLREQVPPHHGD